MGGRPTAHKNLCVYERKCVRVDVASDADHKQSVLFTGYVSVSVCISETQSKRIKAVSRL